MICFPDAKINIGLKILNKREDGYHNIESVLYPIPFCDVLEINENSTYKISYSGLHFNKLNEYLNEMMSWLQIKGWTKPISVHLHKIIPAGSGLGGGSADLAFLTKYVLDKVVSPSIKKEIKEKAIDISTDTAFFLRNAASLVTNKGNVLKSIEIDLSGYYLLLLFPGIKISTAMAYRSMEIDLNTKVNWSLISSSPENWRDHICNDFEFMFSKQYDQYYETKSALYHAGADYVSLTGTGSTIYAIFKKRKDIDLKHIGLSSKWINL